ncbi:MAG: hypothetical protein C4519_19435 [Desulfobacteraceae bacterium]|nr:MAG: hypothetical protein C4519_19435 [Desulfobacteraceae bacterium]
MLNAAENGQGLDYLINRSGFFGRQILKVARLLYSLQVRLRQPDGGSLGIFGKNHTFLRIMRGVEALALFLFTYYVGGSLTRRDQHALAQLIGMGAKRAYRLTLYNSLLFGLPTAAVYFLLGEGFQWVGNLHSVAAIPSWVVGNTSRLIGAASLTVDLFRAIDAAWNGRCWAPLGTFPILINLPTYVKMAGRRLLGNNHRSVAPKAPRDPSETQD